MTACSHSPFSHRGAQVRSRASPCEIYGGQIGSRTDFSEYVVFTLSLSCHQCPIFIRSSMTDAV
jgi:hypothetical protein